MDIADNKRRPEHCKQRLVELTNTCSPLVYTLGCWVTKGVYAPLCTFSRLQLPWCITQGRHKGHLSPSQHSVMDSTTCASSVVPRAWFLPPCFWALPDHPGRIWPWAFIAAPLMGFPNRQTCQTGGCDLLRHVPWVQPPLRHSMRTSWASAPSHCEDQPCKLRQPDSDS